MGKIFNFIRKALTHNHCDTCGFTKEEVFVTEFYSEGGLLQCENCFNNKSE